MKRKLMNPKIVALCLSALFALIILVAATPRTEAASAILRRALAKDRATLMQFTSGGHVLGFTPQGMYAATGSHALHVDFVNTNNVQPQADVPVNPSTSLRTGPADGKAAPIGRVTYADLWDGINLAYTASAGNVYITTYTLAPGADAKNIRLLYNAPLTLNKNGTLNIAFKTGRLTESAPIAWQNIDGKRVAVDASFRVRGQEVTFALGKYDPRHPLTIDPSLTWHTFLGGSGGDWGRAIAVDGSGNIYVAGNSYASWGSPVRIYSSDRDGFAAKLSSSGALIWNTFLGYNGIDAANGIAVDGSGNVYVVGDSTSAWTCLDLLLCTVNDYVGDVDAFAAKLDSSGHLDWNTFMGSSDTDYGTAIAVNTISNPNVVWVAGDNRYLWNFVYEFDAFVTKLDLSGNYLTGTTLGTHNQQNDFANAIAVDGSGIVYVAGDSDATWGSPVRSHQGGVDAFAAKLGSSAALLWHTFLGGSGTDHGYGIAVGSGNVYVAGESNAAWTCLDLFQCTVWDFNGGTDAFAAKLDSSGHLDWNTFLGGSADDSGRGIAVDGRGNVYVAGYSDARWGGPPFALWDAFAARLSSSGALMANIFLGGSGFESGNGLAVDGSRNAYVVGYGDDWGSPVRAHFNNSNYDAFVAKVDLNYRIYLPLTLKNF